jgi:hypothetical protein
MLAPVWLRYLNMREVVTTCLEPRIPQDKAKFRRALIP